MCVCVCVCHTDESNGSCLMCFEQTSKLCEQLNGSDER